MKYKKLNELKNSEKRKYYLLIFFISLVFNIIFLGATLNQIVIYLNDNHMPVLMHTVVYTNDGIHSYYEYPSEVNMFYLSDIFEVGPGTYSIGDSVIVVGSIFIFIICVKLAILDYKLRK